MAGGARSETSVRGCCWRLRGLIVRCVGLFAKGEGAEGGWEGGEGERGEKVREASCST